MSKVSDEMLKVGITGGIACGKSNITKLLIKKGYHVIDSDAISRKLSEPGESIFKAIYREFGENFFSDGRLDRAKLGRYIFENEAARLRINEITHSIIVEEIERQLQKSQSDIIFLDIPLLFEAHLEYLCDKIICVFVPYEIQLKRLMERESIDEEFAKRKIVAQEKIEIKINKSDYVISTDGSFEKTEEKLDHLLEILKGV